MTEGGSRGQTPGVETTRSVRDASRLRRFLMAVLIVALLIAAAVSRTGRTTDQPPPTSPGTTDAGRARPVS